MSRIASTLAPVALLLLSLSSADRGPEVGSCDETALLQVKQEVTPASRRAEEDSIQKAKSPVVLTEGSSLEGKPPVRAEPPPAVMMDSQTTEKATAKTLPEVGAAPQDAALDSQIPIASVPGLGYGAGYAYGAGVMPEVVGAGMGYGGVVPQVVGAGYGAVPGIGYGGVLPGVVGAVPGIGYGAVPGVGYGGIIPGYGGIMPGYGAGLGYGAAVQAAQVGTQRAIAQTSAAAAERVGATATVQQAGYGYPAVYPSPILPVNAIA